MEPIDKIENTEIKITPEMIEAGVDVLRAEPFIDLRLSIAREVVREIILRTWKAQKF
jgi:hypothetical protein